MRACLVLPVLLAAALGRTPRNCGLACNSVKKCLAVLNGSGGNRPGQLGNTGIIVLETCSPKLAKAKKKGCTCQEELDEANDADEKASFHSATQSSVRTRGGRPVTTPSPAPATLPSRRPSRFSSRGTGTLPSRGTGTARATASIVRPALRPLRTLSRPSTSASFSVSSSVSTSTATARTPRLSLRTQDRSSRLRSLFADRNARFRRRY